MTINRTLSSLFALGAGLLMALVMVSGVAAQQTPQNYDNAYAYGNAPNSNAYPQAGPSLLPFSPVGFVQKWDPFAPADISDYGTGPKAKIGFFFSYERCYWSIGKPARATVGDAALNGTEYTESFNPITGLPVMDKEFNSLDTGIFTAKGSWGNRWETGFMDVNDHGWLISVIDHVAQTQNFSYSNATVLFNDPNNVIQSYVVNPFGASTINPITGRIIPTLVPVETVPRFPETLIYNRVVLNGTEIMRMYRIPRLHNGGYIDLLAGARWLQVDDTFEFDGYGGVLADTIVRSRVQNNMVGPQVGFRYFQQRGRWINSVEGRFMASANFENFREQSTFASAANALSTLGGIPASGVIQSNLNANANNQSKFASKFAPVGEIRLQTVYQVTRAVGLKIGYTFLGINGINRASNHVDYTASTFGLLNPGGRDSLIINGLNFGVEVNR